MQPIGRFLGSFLLAATVIVPVVSPACTRVRYDDAYYGDDYRCRPVRTADRGSHTTNDTATGRNSNEQGQRDDWKSDQPDRD